MIRLAVIADPHFHNCNWVPKDSGLPGAIRSFADSIDSTRVFNESAAAFRAALDHAVAAGAKLAILVGDLTDDGQAPNIDAAVALLADYRRLHGLRVFATLGNHDCFAQSGRPQVKNFIAADGRCIAVDSATAPDAATLGTLPALQKMARLGYQPDPDDLHWETPFGQNPDWAARSYATFSPDGATQCPMIDASYLVEPVAGLWLLSIDANVCVPRDGATDFSDPAQFHDPSNGGWPSLLRHRAHLLGWMTDVAARAKAAGKQLIAFSHYPVLDPLAGASADEVALFGATGLARRAPGPAVAQAFAATGVAVHFSGHLHVNDTALYQTTQSRFLNIAVPSPVGFPPAMKLAEIDHGQISLRTVSLAQAAGHDAAFAAYRAEAQGTGLQARATDAKTYGAFMDHHLRAIAQGRYIAREWPKDMAAFLIGHQMSDLLALIGVALHAPDLPLPVFAEDWYRLRKGGALALPYIPAQRLTFYRALCAQLPKSDGTPLAAQFVALLRMMRAYLDRLPNGDFVIDMADLRITPL
ncbi:metallophosphoesterase [Cypionkella aquatica]|uniref:Metallophosphoesterase n=1 Tax=Cypionkella aquatica TaxID=1756042 RepID=A0AA37X0Q4_9RHOB|nr:metallophosphoesterase [Cypionkella aquatica]GLS87124.1 metallophosphoesterase [Cypionkella aquatica]